MNRLSCTSYSCVQFPSFDFGFWTDNAQSDYVVGDVEMSAYSAPTFAGRAPSYGSGTHSYGSRSVASGTPVEDDSGVPSGSVLQQQLLQHCEMQRDYTRLLGDTKSSNVRIGIQRYDAIQAGIQIWRRKQGTSEWPSFLANIKVDSIRSIWWAKSAYHDWQGRVNDLEKLAKTSAACADMLAWCREQDSKSDRVIWGDRFKSNGNYSLGDLKGWIGDIERQQALDAYTASKEASKSHKKRK